VRAQNLKLKDMLYKILLQILEFPAQKYRAFKAPANPPITDVGVGGGSKNK
jgi:hypothetical protein